MRSSIVFTASLFAMAGSFAETAEAKDTPCAKLFSQWNITPEDRSPASIDESKALILQAISEENDPERLKVISRFLLETTLEDQQNRELKLAMLSTMVKKGADLKKFLSPCSKDGAKEVFGKK